MSHYPVAIIEDRYSGSYSGGRWLAISVADEIVKGEDITRAAYVLSDGPHATDIHAMDFWREPPDWIAVGDSPADAHAALIAGIRPTPFRRKGEA